MPRTLTGITDAIINDAEIELWDFVKVTLASPVGVQRFTNRPGGYVGNIDGTSQTWLETDLELGPIKLSRESVLQVNWIKFSNLDYAWTNWAYTPGLRGAIVDIYTAWWNTTTFAFAGVYKSYEGLVDVCELSNYAQLSLRPHHTPWNYRILPEELGGKCINIYRNPEDCQFVGAEPGGQITCSKTRADCLLRNNMININIYDDTPKFNEKVVWSGSQISIPSSPYQGVEVSAPNKRRAAGR